MDKTPQRTKLVDTFMAFLVVVGVLQFVYCVIAGNFVSSTALYDVKRDVADRYTALQCVLERLQCDGWTIRPHS